MPITYTWEVTGIKVKNTESFQNAIVQTYWRKIGTDGEHTAQFSGATPFDADQIDPNNFTSLDQLTEEMVIGWIKNVVVDDYEEHVNGRIEKAINDMKNPESEIEGDALPWKT